MEIIYILLGWLFGILSPGITNHISNYYKKKELEKVIIGELKDLKKRLVFLPFRINLDYDTVDKKLIDWTIKETQNYKELDLTDDFKDGLEKIKIFINNKDHFKDLELFNSLRKKDKPAFHFKKMITSTIDSNLINIGVLDDKLLIKLLDIKFQVNAFNEEIQNINEYLKMTFNSNITDVNHQIISREIDIKNSLISEKAILIVKKINCILYPNEKEQN